MNKFLIPIVIIVLAAVGFVVFKQRNSTTNPAPASSTRSSYQGEDQAQDQQTGDSDQNGKVSVDDIEADLLAGLSAEASLAAEADGDASVATDDGAEVNNLGNVYEGQF